jgi:RNA polymerase-binding transcription factor
MDQLDHAKELEIKQREIALEAHFKNQKEEPPHEVDGIRYCLDCDDEIPKKRLQARPEAVRCIDCKSDKEKREAQRA